MASNLDTRLPMTASALSRRAALRNLGGAGMATALALSTGRTSHAAEASSVAMIEPDAGTWKTWLLTSGDQLRPEAPPAEAATAHELAEVQATIAGREVAAIAARHALV
jgi:hypothetical protein